MREVVTFQFYPLPIQRRSWLVSRAATPTRSEVAKPAWAGTEDWLSRAVNVLIGTPFIYAVLKRQAKAVLQRTAESRGIDWTGNAARVHRVCARAGRNAAFRGRYRRPRHAAVCVARVAAHGRTSDIPRTGAGDAQWRHAGFCGQRPALTGHPESAAGALHADEVHRAALGRLLHLRRGGGIARYAWRRQRASARDRSATPHHPVSRAQRGGRQTAGCLVRWPHPRRGADGFSRRVRRGGRDHVPERPPSDYPARLAYFALHSLQHRGQEGAGIVVAEPTAGADGAGALRDMKGLGLVAEVFTDRELMRTSAVAAVGHVRYSTAGHRPQRQPDQRQRPQAGVGDPRHHLQHLVGHRGDPALDGAVGVRRSGDTQARLTDALGHVEGAYALCVLTLRELFAVRDPRGFRPLVLGRIASGEPAWMVASESCALDMVGAEVPGQLRRVRPFGVHVAISFRRAVGALVSNTRRCRLCTAGARQRRRGGAGFQCRQRHSLPDGHHAQPVRWPHLHPTDAGDPRCRRQVETVAGAVHDRGQAGRAAAAGRGRQRGAPAHRLPAHYRQLLLRGRHAQSRGAHLLPPARRPAGVRVDRRRLPRLSQPGGHAGVSRGRGGRLLLRLLHRKVSSLAGGLGEELRAICTV
eukprot:ctg_382.g249